MSLSRWWSSGSKVKLLLSRIEGNRYPGRVTFFSSLPYRTRTVARSELTPLLTGETLLEDLKAPTKKKRSKKTSSLTESLVTGGVTSSDSKVLVDSISEPGIPNSRLLQTVLEYQNANPQYIALVRVGDFYELYYEQADLCGDLLALLVVDKKVKGHKIRFTGFPCSQLERHLETLVNRHGKCVAVLEQFQDPISKQFDRRVDRIFTPGTLIGEQFLDSTQANYLLALFLPNSPSKPNDSSIRYLKENVGMAWLDLATGDFQLGVTFGEELATELARLKPREIVVPANFNINLITDSIQISQEPSTTFQDPPQEGGSLDDLLQRLDSFSSLEQQAGWGLLNYVVKTQGGRDLNLQLPVSRDDPRRLKIDPAVLKCLEINTPKTKSALLSHLNNTITKAGSRLLAKRLASPSTHIPTIEARLDLMDAFKKEPALCLKLTKLLTGARDAQRSLQKLSLGHACPEDVIDILSMLDCSKELKSLLKASPVVIIRELANSIEIPEYLAEAINDALDCEVPHKALGKGVIKSEFNPKLINLHQTCADLFQAKDQLESSLKSLLGTKSLKLTSSGVFGYYLEIHQKDYRSFLENEDKLASAPLFFQELKGRKRYYLKEWTELSSQMNQTEEDILETEKGIFKDICIMILNSRDVIIKNCQTIAEVDVASSLARTSQTLCLVRPKLSAAPKLNIQAARHLSVEIALQQQRRQFTSNHCELDASPELIDTHPDNPGRLWIITGPNMGGKTTFLRQIASIVILAQAGFPVPADTAEIGIVDQIFSRVGSADNLIQEQSTFMVEMQEMANILNRATYRSLVIADEIGRGTSTHEGEAIAFAILHYLHHRIRCRTLFATHFHNLAQTAALSDSSLCLPAARSHHTRVATLEDGQFAFLHDLLPGASTSSYATLVAHLAQIPSEVIDHAESLLQTDPFARASSSPNDYQPVISTLQTTSLDHITPVEALLLLRRLQALIPTPSS